jgi:subtilisin family serine protease
MKAIGATKDGSYRVEQGDRRTLVAVLDSGVDASHPDLAGKVDRVHSANLLPPGASGANEPADTDPLGNGTMAAGLVGAKLNGLGIAGVAPRVSLVSFRVADSNGFVFLGPVVDGLLRSARLGASVANMAFVLDPWLFACPSNRADSPAQQAEQRAITTVLSRAVEYARIRGVLPVATIGSSAMNLDHPTVDDGSPSYPARKAHHRNLDPSCRLLPGALPGVVGASRLGPDMRLASSSNYGLSVADVAVPGGEVGSPAERVLSTFSRKAAVANGMVDKNGKPLTPLLLRDCRGRTCAYYYYTALGSPSVAGVAALIVSHYGHPDYAHDGHLALAPAKVEHILQTTATPTPCPPGSLTCVGPPGNNNHYGRGLVNALAAVTS